MSSIVSGSDRSEGKGKQCSKSSHSLNEASEINIDDWLEPEDEPVEDSPPNNNIKCMEKGAQLDFHAGHLLACKFGMQARLSHCGANEAAKEYHIPAKICVLPSHPSTSPSSGRKTKRRIKASSKDSVATDGGAKTTTKCSKREALSLHRSLPTCSLSAAKEAEDRPKMKKMVKAWKAEQQKNQCQGGPEVDDTTESAHTCATMASVVDETDEKEIDDKRVKKEKKWSKRESRSQRPDSGGNNSKSPNTDKRKHARSPRIRSERCDEADHQTRRSSFPNVSRVSRRQSLECRSILSSEHVLDTSLHTTTTIETTKVNNTTMTELPKAPFGAENEVSGTPRAVSGKVKLTKKSKMKSKMRSSREMESRRPSLIKTVSARIRDVGISDEQLEELLSAGLEIREKQHT